MSGICVTTLFGAVLVTMPLDQVTLAWSHSVEKTRWEEDYVRRANYLELVSARVHGNAAGMEIPEGAMRRGGAWEFKPKLPMLERVTLAASHESEDYLLCANGKCRALRALTRAEGPLVLRACP